MADERRLYTRVSVAVDAQLTSAGLEPKAVKVLDLSQGGARLSGGGLEPETFVKVFLPLPAQGGPRLHVCLGRVAWTSARQVGVEFIGVDESTEQALRRSVEFAARAAA